MKVLLVSSMYKRDKQISSEFVHRQVLELVRLGVNVHVVCPIGRLSSSASLRSNIRMLRNGRTHTSIGGVPVTFLPYWNAPHRFAPGLDVASLRRSLQAELRTLRRTFRFDVLHVNRLFPVGTAAILVARNLGVPLVVGARGSDVHTTPYRSPAVYRYTCQTIRQASVYAVSQRLASEIHQLARPKHPVQVVYNGVDTERFRPLGDRPTLRKRLGLPVDGIGICVVSRIVEEKGLFELIDAFAEISSRIPDSWLAVVGNGPSRERLAARIERTGLAPRVFLVGAQPHERVPEWLNAADIFTLPSYNEGLPNVVLEAMACGLPVVATDVGGTAEVVEHGSTGLLVAPRDSESLAAALLELCADHSTRQRMACNGLARIRDHFGWDRSAHALLDLYQSLLRS